MPRFLCCFLLLLPSLPAFAATPGPDVVYVGGTIATPVTSTSGVLDLSSQDALLFKTSAGNITVPWTSIQSWTSYSQTTHHIGVLPAIAVGLVRKRQRSHFLRIAWKDERKSDQGVLFEIPKQMPAVVETALNVRAPTKKQFLPQQSGD